MDRSKRFTLFAFPGRPVHSDTNSASPGSILVRQQLRAKTKSLTCPPLSIARYSFIQLSQLGPQWRERKCHIFETVAKGDSNPGSLDCESGILPLSYRSVCLFAPHLVLASFLAIFNRRLALAAVFSMCFLIESFGSSCMSRYCGASSLCISSTPYLIVTLFSTLYLLEKMVYTFLFVLSFSFHKLQYVHRLRRLVLTLACALYMFALVDQSTVSSA